MSRLFGYVFGVDCEVDGSHIIATLTIPYPLFLHYVNFFIKGGGGHNDSLCPPPLGTLTRKTYYDLTTIQNRFISYIITLYLLMQVKYFFIYHNFQDSTCPIQNVID